MAAHQHSGGFRWNSQPEGLPLALKRTESRRGQVGRKVTTDRSHPQPRGRGFDSHRLRSGTRTTSPPEHAFSRMRMFRFWLGVITGTDRAAQHAAAGQRRSSTRPDRLARQARHAFGVLAHIGRTTSALKPTRAVRHTFDRAVGSPDPRDNPSPEGSASRGGTGEVSRVRTLSTPRTMTPPPSPFG